ncbi:hypothetical protein PR202_gb29435 [Eleusine coracana subsp. coracana]|uniref:Uncharacterized protein n=1 Tax=Eleusine coracana subsp. coracana TaxID=191504 RepID=A0AAV5FZA6_ELECO|nr:hypothetical protein PR202_gb29435 [Eleusine coracana subsp. coracana]
MIAWNFERNGVFSVRSAYRLGMRLYHDLGLEGSSLSPEGERKVWGKFWKLRVPSKVKIFGWKIVHNGLPTRANKHYRHLDQQQECQLCGDSVEDGFHAVLRCPHAAALRQAMHGEWALSAEEDLINTGLDWLLMLVDRYSGEIMANLLMILWRFWSVRNGVLQAGDTISIAGSAEFLKRYMSALLQVRQCDDGLQKKGKACLFQAGKVEGRSRPPEDKRWVPPRNQMLKINVDGAFNEQTWEAAVGVIIRDTHGAPYLAAWRILYHCRDAEEAEIRACLEGIKLASRWFEGNFVLESDCSMAVQMINTGRGERSRCAPLIREIQEEGHHLHHLEVTKIGREQNKVEHELAQIASVLRERLGEMSVS